MSSWARMLACLGWAGWLVSAAGCSSQYLSANNAGIERTIAPPSLPPAPSAPQSLPDASSLTAVPERVADELPEPVDAPEEVAPAPADETISEAKPSPPPRKPGPVTLEEVLSSVRLNFPLLLAAEQERVISSGQRLAAEGGFDLNLRARGTTQGGTFPSDRFDLLAEQPTPLAGLSLFSGYRVASGDFPVYYGDRVTADGGEFRAGAVLPLLKDSEIDRRRATLRQAQISETMADPVVRRALIDFLRAAAKSYWTWVASGEQLRVAAELLSIASERQTGLAEQFRQGQVAEFVVIDNRRLIAERDGAKIAAERRFQQASFDLSLFLRDASGNPLIPLAAWLPTDFADRELPSPPTARLAEAVLLAYDQRPELTRFALLKERTAVDLQLARNQGLPALNAAVAAAQDVGDGKDSTGIFALDRSLVEGSLLFEVPLQRREAVGRARAAEGTLAQLTAQERFARDQIAAEVQDAVSNLDRTYQRVARAREEQGIARRVAELEAERFRKGQSNLLEVNLRELAAAGAAAKVIDALADYFRAEADRRAALGSDGNPALFGPLPEDAGAPRKPGVRP